MVDCTKLLKKFVLVKDIDDWSRELDFERRQRTNLKESQFIGWHSLYVFALRGHGRSDFYMIEPERWSQHVAHRALGAPILVVYLYRTAGICKGSAASLFVGRILEAEYTIFSPGAFLRAVQYGPVSCFAHDQMMSACAGRDAFLRIP